MGKRKMISLRTWCESHKDFGAVLMNQWIGIDINYEKVNLDEISFSSARVLMWKCENGHIFPMKVSIRTSFGCDCPACDRMGNSDEVPEGNLLDWCTSNIEKGERIIHEWTGLDANGNKINLNISPYSNSKVKWECECGHRWVESVASRISGDMQCPVCKKQNVGVLTDNTERKDDMSTQVVTGEDLRTVCNKNPGLGRHIQDAWLGESDTGVKIKMSDVSYCDDTTKIIWKRKGSNNFVATAKEVYEHVKRMNGLKADEGDYFKYEIGSLGMYCLEHPEKADSIRESYGDFNKETLETVMINKRAEWVCKSCGKEFKRKISKQIEIGDFKCDSCLENEYHAGVMETLRDKKNKISSTAADIKLARDSLKSVQAVEFNSRPIRQLRMFDVCVQLGDFGDLIFKLFTGVTTAKDKKEVNIRTLHCWKGHRLYWFTDNNSYVIRTPIEQLNWMVENIVGEKPDICYGKDLRKYAEKFASLKKEQESGARTASLKVRQVLDNRSTCTNNSSKLKVTVESMPVVDWCIKNPDLAEIMLNEWTGIRCKESSSGWYKNIHDARTKSDIVVLWKYRNGLFIVKSIEERIRELANEKLELSGDTVSLNTRLYKYIEKSKQHVNEVRDKIRAAKEEKQVVNIDSGMRQEEKTMNNENTVKKSFYDSEVKTDNSMFNWSGQNPEIGIQFMLEWTWLDENGQTVSPYDEAFDSERLVRWKDKEGHEWLESCANRTKYKSICPYCNKAHDECKKGQFPV